MKQSAVGGGDTVTLGFIVGSGTMRARVTTSKAPSWTPGVDGLHAGRPEDVAGYGPDNFGFPSGAALSAPAAPSPHPAPPTQKRQQAPHLPLHSLEYDTLVLV